MSLECLESRSVHTLGQSERACARAPVLRPVEWPLGPVVVVFGVLGVFFAFFRVFLSHPEGGLDLVANRQGAI